MYKIIYFFISLFTISSACFGQWKSSNNGLDGGEVVCITANDNKLFAGTRYGGVFASNDNGENWYSSSIGMGDYVSVTALSNNGNYIIAGTYKRGVFVSSDNGENWSHKKDSIIDNSNIISVLVNKDKSFVCTEEDGIFLSKDNGETWLPKNKGIDSGLINHSMVLNEGNIYLVAGIRMSNTQLLYVTYDNGDNWIRIGAGSGLGPLMIKNATIYCLMSDRIYISSDEGKTWNFKLLNIDNNDAYSIVSSGNELIIGTVNSGIYISNDDGQSWDNCYKSIPNYRVQSLISNKNYVYAATVDGVLISSDNGINWSKKKKGISSITINFIFKSKNILLAGTRYWGVFISKDNGENWEQKNNGLTNFTISSIAELGNNIILASNIGLFVSTNEGESWELSSEKFDKPVYYLAVKGNDLFFSKENSIFKTNNLGKSSVDLKMGVESFLVYGDRLFVGHWSGVVLTTNNGISWIEKNNGFDFKPVKKLSKFDNTIVAGTFFRGIFISKDYGENWVERNKGLKNRSIISLASNNNHIFAGTQDGIFLSKDKGYNWKAENDGLLEVPVKTLMITDEYIYAGTDGRGIYSAKLSEFGTTDVNEFADIDNEILIYPNPAEDYITINLSKVLKPFVTDDSPSNKGLQHFASDKVQIFDMLGIEVGQSSLIDITTHNNSQSGMIDLLKIDVSHLPAGVYFIRIGTRVEKFVKM